MEEEIRGSKKPSKLWYLLPIFLNIIGGVIGYFLLKDRDRKFAERLLIIGLVMIAVAWVANFLLAGIAYIYLSGIMRTKTATLISILDSSCSGGIITSVISNDGTKSVSVSSIEFSLNGQKTIPSGCSGYIEPHSTVVCKIGSDLSGIQRMEIKGPSNKVIQSVPC